MSVSWIRRSNLSKAPVEITDTSWHAATFQMQQAGHPGAENVCRPVAFLHLYTLILLTGLISTLPRNLAADELQLSWGYGHQQDARQSNEQVAIDYEFFEYVRSARTRLSVGVGYTHLTTDADTHRKIQALSVYPQLTLTPVTESINDFYFFVRALGPSYMSENALGEREQDNHFSFQAQVGIGYMKKLENDNAVKLQVSFKHFSNADLFSDNDGYDIPFVLTLGYKF